MFIDTPRGARTELWRYIATISITILAFVLAHLPLIGLVNLFAARSGLDPEDVDQILSAGNLVQFGIGPNLAFAAMVLPFATALVALLLCVRFIHHHPVLALVTTRARFDVARLGFGTLVWMVLAGAAILLALPHNAVSYQFHWPAFASFALIAIVMLPLQVAAEEVFFRGYLLKMFGQVLRLPLWPLLITTCLFAAVHLANPEFKIGLWSVIPAYVGLSLFLGLLTILDDGLELPVGVHLGNNLFTALILSTHDGAMITPSVMQTNVAAIIHSFWVVLLVIPIATGCFHITFPLGWHRLLGKRDPLTVTDNMAQERNSP